MPIALVAEHSAAPRLAVSAPMWVVPLRLSAAAVRDGSTRWGSTTLLLPAAISARARVVANDWKRAMSAEGPQRCDTPCVSTTNNQQSPI